MSQARIEEIIDLDYVKPLKEDLEYETHKIKTDYLKNHLLTAIIGSNANSFISPRAMDGIDMYIKLLEVLQGNDHEKEKEVNATTEFKN